MLHLKVALPHHCISFSNLMLLIKNLHDQRRDSPSSWCEMLFSDLYVSLWILWYMYYRTGARALMYVALRDPRDSEPGVNTQVTHMNMEYSRSLFPQSASAPLCKFNSAFTSSVC